MSRKYDESMDNERFEKRYISGDLPWDIGRADFNLTSFISLNCIKPCKVLDVGCGTGDSAIWLSQQGFNVTGIDSSVNAIKMAKEKMIKRKVDVTFQNIDFFNLDSSKKFDFVFDRGCFHSFGKSMRDEFSKKVSSLLVERGVWLSIMGNLDDGFREIGPPQLSCVEVATAIEPYFEIISLTSKYFDSNIEVIPKSWVCLSKKRKS